MKTFSEPDELLEWFVRADNLILLKQPHTQIDMIRCYFLNYNDHNDLSAYLSCLCFFYTCYVKETEECTMVNAIWDPWDIPTLNPTLTILNVNFNGLGTSQGCIYLKIYDLSD